MNSTKRSELKHKASVLAEKMREDLHLSSTMPLSIHQAVRENNIQTYFRPMDDGCSGMAVKVNDSRFMMINTNKPLGHQRFTCCHEFYHLLYQERFTSVKENTALFIDSDQEEFTADWFASFLLLPENGIKYHLLPEEIQKDRISIDTLLKIEHIFRCSRRTLLFRLKDMGLISSGYFDFHCTNVKYTSSRYGYPIDIYEASRKVEFIGDYNVKARELFDKGLISQAKYDSLLEDIGIDFSKQTEDNGEV